MEEGSITDPPRDRGPHRGSLTLLFVSQPTLIIWGANDRVLSDVPGAIRAAGQIPGVRQVVIPKCGHAPQIEKARLVNQLISNYLRDKLKTIPPDLDPYRFLSQSTLPHKFRARLGETLLNLPASR